jgi:hypothetical protein
VTDDEQDGSSGREIDLGVTDGRTGRPPQDRRPESDDDATLPGSEGAATVDAPGDEPAGGGPSGDEFGGDGDEAGPGFEEPA